MEEYCEIIDPQSYDASTLSLYNIVLRVIIDNINVIATCDFNQTPPRFKLRDEVVLPAKICGDFLRFYQEIYPIDDGILEIFRDTARTKLHRVKIDSSSITCSGFKTVMKHKPMTLELVKCSSLIPDCLNIISENSENLTGLTIRIKSAIFPFESDESSLYMYSPAMQYFPTFQPCLIDLSEVLPSLIGLTHLDLSGCRSCNLFSSLPQLENLQSLILHDTETGPTLVIPVKMYNLRHLDISQSLSQPSEPFKEPERVLIALIESLPALESLDISGTNLIKHKLQQDSTCSLPALYRRKGNPLKFLGICSLDNCFHCRNSPQYNIPAINIASLNNLNQTVVAAKVYKNRLSALAHVVVEILQCFEENLYDDVCEASHYALPVFLEVMEYYLKDAHFQQICCSTLYVIQRVIWQYEGATSMDMRKKIVSLLISTIQLHIENEYIVRIGCQILAKIMAMVIETLHEYDRLVMLLLHLLANSMDNHVLRYCIPVFVALTCKVNCDAKLELAAGGMFKNMLRVISEYLLKGTFDTILVIAWLALSNFTNGIPESCELFITLEGLQYFVQCVQNYPTQLDLLIPMTGVISNISKMVHLRTKLAVPSVIGILKDILENPQISDIYPMTKYNALESIAYLVSEGPMDWTLSDPSFYSILETLGTAVCSLSNDPLPVVQYESLHVMLNLLQNSQIPQCLLWGVAIIDNLLLDDARMYTALLVEEGGVPVIADLTHSTNGHIERSDEPRDVYLRIANVLSSIVRLMQTSAIDAMEE